MWSLNSFKSNIFHIDNQNFEQHALNLFKFQCKHNRVYRKYVQNLNIVPDEVSDINKIPFMPIQFFKKHKIKTGNFKPQQIFESSGTAGAPSKHCIEDMEFYNEISLAGFTLFFGEIDKTAIIGLLPSYLERNNSSLVYMVNHFICKSNNPNSGFYLENFDLLNEKLKALSKSQQHVYLFGVTFALLDLAKSVNFDMKNLYIFETGGMKGRGKEIIREELHEKLSIAFNTNHIFSEYGMTELLSQAYLQKDGYFHTPPWMRIMIREIHDPFSYIENGKAGVIKVIDLANIHSCAFIETEDLGRQVGDGFKVLGRLDNSDLRGCNLLLS